ncbi:MAG TPA: Ldh family oxidoreductase [Candidatus Paceibacterota bacterium]|nr:Ldh family oxidoreductase [Candidatus Paceibacterota bacterium]
MVRRGANPSQAAVVFDDYLDAELRGRVSHGFASWPVALSAFPTSGSFVVGKDAGSVVQILGNGDCGHTVARYAADLALERLSRVGVVIVGVNNITRFNCPGVLARHIAERGAIALVLEYGGSNLMVPVGGKSPALSTNPIGIAVPGTSPLFVLDFATSERAIGHVALAKLAEQRIPREWGVDADGRQTTDPKAVVGMLPFGGYKGFGLSLAFEILSGALVGVPIGSKGSPRCRGALMMVISPTVFGGADADFAAAAQQFLDEVRSSSPAMPGDPVVYPGVVSEQRYLDAMTRGTVIFRAPVWATLNDSLN